VGFSGDEQVAIYLDEPRELLTTVTANSLGSFVGATAAQVTIPATAQPGLNALIGIGQTSGTIGIGKINVD
jgi:hypothetical protein